MRRSEARSGLGHLLPAAVIGLAILAMPAAVAAADDAVTGAAVTGAAIGPLAWPDTGVDPGPGLLLLVAGTLGVLGALSGPTLAAPDDRHATHPRERGR